MCSLLEINKGIYVADIKAKYVLNIIENAKKCLNIDRIMLFGSATNTRCNEYSDIDIAVFGSKKKNLYLRTKEYRRFLESIFSFDGEFFQDYDILYFESDKEYNDLIIEDINNGVEIYRRK